jgi:hypothetical protein
MDQVERLIAAFGSRGKRNQSLWKLDILLDLGRLDDARVVRFLVDLVGDAEEPVDVRSDALRRLREASLDPDVHTLAVAAAVRALAPGTDGELRLRAAVVLGDFVDVEGVLDALAAVVSDQLAPLELRYDAFTSLQRAGPTAPCVDILRSLVTDETFGQSARALLTSWRLC